MKYDDVTLCYFGINIHTYNIDVYLCTLLNEYCCVHFYFQDKEDKIIENTLAFKAWSESKKDFIHKKVKDKRHVEEKERKKIEDERDRKRDAEHVRIQLMYFQNLIR